MGQLYASVFSFLFIYLLLYLINSFQRNNVQKQQNNREESCLSSTYLINFFHLSSRERFEKNKINEIGDSIYYFSKSNEMGLRQLSLSSNILQDTSHVPACGLLRYTNFKIMFAAK